MLRIILSVTSLIFDILFIAVVGLSFAMGKMHGPAAIVGWALIITFTLNLAAIQFGARVSTQGKPRRDAASIFE